ncbi:MAG: 50S ribosomal protein L11 methyltransferase [Saprospiraceae bacterium]|nr:50S ribosomal protein L11 methyltransferase [Saprospiraceae bacterium]
MNYYQYSIQTDTDTAEMLMAFLSDGDFDTFEEMPEGINAYVPASASLEAAESLLSELQAQFSFTWRRAFIPGQNWNELWESNFQPVIVGSFCAVRADFHPPIPDVRWELVINPKMAFGTGHHETTWQCIAAIEHLPLVGAKVLDYGCGTGILAILAAKQGAAVVEAVDIEEESYRNTLENCEANKVYNITTRQGTLAAVQGRNFDGILANINRHVILESLPDLAGMIKPGGWLLISGILLSDEAIVTDAAKAAGFIKKTMGSRGNWLCGVFERII